MNLTDISRDAHIELLEHYLAAVDHECRGGIGTSYTGRRHARACFCAALENAVADGAISAQEEVNWRLAYKNAGLAKATPYESVAH